MLNKGRTWKAVVVTAHVFILSCVVAASIAQSSGSEASVGSNVAQNGQNFGFGSGFARPETVTRNARQGPSQGGNAPFLSSFLQKFQNFLNRVTDLTATLNRRRENLNNAYNFNTMPVPIPAMLQNVAPDQQNAPLLNNPSALTLETVLDTKNKSTVNRRFQRQNKSFNDDDDSDLPPIITSEEEEDGSNQALTAGSTGESGQSAISQAGQVGGKNMMDLLIAAKTQAELEKVQEAAKESEGNVVINDEDDDEDTRDFAPFPSFDDDEEAGGGFDAEVEIPNIKNQKNAAASASPPPQISTTTSSTTTSQSRPPVNQVTNSAESERDLEDLAPTFGEEDEEEDDTSATGVQPPANQPILFQSTPAPPTTRATTTTTTRQTTTTTTTTTARPTTRTTPRTTTTTPPFSSSVDSLVDLAEDYDKEIDEPPPPVITTRRPMTTVRTTARPPLPTILRSTTTPKPLLPPAADLLQNIVPASPSFPKQNNRPNPPQSYTTRLNQRPQQTTPQYSNDGLRYPNANAPSPQSFNQGPLLQFLNPSEPSGLQPQFNQDQGFPQRNSQTPPISLDNIAELIRNHLLQNLYSAVQSTTGNLFRAGGQPGQSSPTIIHIGPININTGSNGRLNYGTRGSGEQPGLQPFTNGEVAADRTGPRKADTNLSTPRGPFQPSTKSITNMLPTKPLTSIQSSEITDQFDLPPRPNDQTSSSFGSSSSSFPFDGPPPPLPSSDDFGALQDFPPSPVQTASRGFNAQQDGPQQSFLGEASYATDEDNDREKIVTNSGPPVPVIADYDDADEIDLRIMKKG